MGIADAGRCVRDPSREMHKLRVHVEGGQTRRGRADVKMHQLSAPVTDERRWRRRVDLGRCGRDPSQEMHQQGAPVVGGKRRLGVARHGARGVTRTSSREMHQQGPPVGDGRRPRGYADVIRRDRDPLLVEAPSRCHGRR